MPLPGEIIELAAKVSNWGRWGDDDELGCGNLLTDETARRRRIGAQRSADLARRGPQGRWHPGAGQPARRYNPILTVTSLNEARQVRSGHLGRHRRPSHDVDLRGHTSMLSATSPTARFLYNGVPTSAVSAQYGATKLGAEKLPQIVTWSAPRHRPHEGRRCPRRDRTGPRSPLLTSAACERAKVTPQEGDVILVRTGRMRYYHAGDRQRCGRHGVLPARSVGRHDLVDLTSTSQGAFVDTYTRTRRSLPATRLVRLPGGASAPAARHGSAPGAELGLRGAGRCVRRGRTRRRAPARRPGTARGRHVSAGRGRRPLIAHLGTARLVAQLDPTARRGRVVRHRGRVVRVVRVVPVVLRRLRIETS